MPSYRCRSFDAKLHSTIDAVGTGTTNDAGNVIAPIDATSLQGDTRYQDPNSLSINLTVDPADEAGGGGQHLTDDDFYSVTAGGLLQQGVRDTEPLSTGALTCDTTADVLADSAAMAQACGADVSPRDHLVSLQGGGAESVFYDEGSETDQIQPPAGFNPTSATDSQLDEYGFPPRPNEGDSAAYALWLAQVSNIAFDTPRAFDVSVQLTADQTATYDAGSGTSTPECGSPSGTFGGPLDQNCTTFGGYSYQAHPAQ